MFYLIKEDRISKVLEKEFQKASEGIAVLTILKKVWAARVQAGTLQVSTPIPIRLTVSARSSDISSVAVFCPRVLIYGVHSGL